MKINFKKNVTMDVSCINPNISIETANEDHFQIAMGLVRAIATEPDTRVLMYYPEESEYWNDSYSDFFHTVPNVNVDIPAQIEFDDLVSALISVGTFRWANICAIPKNMVLIVPYAEEVIKDADRENLKALAKNCASLGIYLVFISSWSQEEFDISDYNMDNCFVTVGKPTLTSLQLNDISIGDACSFEGRTITAVDGSIPYTVHLFLDITEE